jgi:hypothetical protein
LLRHGVLQMAIDAAIEQFQAIQVSVNGLGDVTAMFIANSLLLAPFDLQSPTGGEGMETVTFSVMLPQPVLAAGQFRRAIASASIAGLASYAADFLRRECLLLTQSGRT